MVNMVTCLRRLQSSLVTQTKKRHAQFCNRKWNSSIFITLYTAEYSEPITQSINQSINQSIIAFCSRAGLSLQTQHSPLYPLLSLPFRICIQSTYHDVVYHLIFSAPRTFFPFTIPSREGVFNLFRSRANLHLL